MKEYTFLNFIRDIGKHLTVNYMMAKDSVKKRLSSESSVGMSFTEFSYQLLQDTISCSCIRTKVAACRWVVPTNGVTSRLELN